MCNRCDNKAVTKKWVAWVGVIVIVGIFILSNVFMYGKVIGVIETHIEYAPTNKEISEGYVSKDEFKTIKEMIIYLYQKEGGK